MGRDLSQGAWNWGMEGKENRPENTEPAPGDPQKARAGTGQPGDRLRQPLQDPQHLSGPFWVGPRGNRMRPRLSQALALRALV